MGKTKTPRQKLVDAVEERKWERVKRLAESEGLKTAELTFLAEKYNELEQNAETDDVFNFVVQQSAERKIQRVLPDLVERGLWRAVSCFMDVRVIGEEQRKQAVEKAMKSAGDGKVDSELAAILPHCTDDQFNNAYTLAVDRGLWSAVRKLIKRRRKSWFPARTSSRFTSEKQLEYCLTKAVKGADDADLSEIALQCIDYEELRETCLRNAVVRGLWEVVGEILQLEMQQHCRLKVRLRQFLSRMAVLVCQRSRPLDGFVFRWAVKEGCKRAGEDVLIRHFLPYSVHADLTELMLKGLVKRKFWKAAAELLKHVADDTESKPELTTPENQPRQDVQGTDKQFDFVVTETLRRELWGVLKELHRQGLSDHDEQQKAVAEKAAVRTGLLGSGEPEVTQEPEEDDDGVPYDRGWAWIVVLGCFLNYLLVNGCSKSTGVIFVALRNHFRAPASHTALLFAVKAGVFSIGGLYVMNVVVSRLGYRKTALIGAVFLSLSGILASLANEINAIIFLQSILLGLSDVMVLTPGDVLVVSYFRRRRSLATAFAKCGTSVGSLAMPQLVTFLLAHFGLHGALLLTGGVCLHALPATLLLRPTSYFKKRAHGRRRNLPETSLEEGVGDEGGYNLETSKQRGSSEGRGKGWSVTSERSSGDESEQRRRDGKRRNLLETSSETDFENGDGNHLEMSNKLRYNEDHEKRTTSAGEGSEKHAETSEKGSESNDTSLERFDKIAEKDSRSGTTTRLLASVKSSLCTLDFSLFRRPMFGLLFAYFMLWHCVNVTVDYLPALASENGLSETQTALLLSIIGGLDVVSRLGSGLLADKKVVRVPTMIIASFLVLGTCNQLVRFMTSFPHFVALAVLQGLLGGVSNCMLAILVLEMVGLDDMGKGMGFYMLGSGSFMAGFYPLLGE
nr:hypothetical protein BaRGS_017981 [Batillaria attramentaria]